MQVEVLLECNSKDPLDVYRHAGAFLASAKMLKDYLEARQVLEGLGPELYAEDWMKFNISYATIDFQNLILVYFAKILTKISDGR